MDNKWPRDPSSRSGYDPVLSTRRASQDGSVFWRGDKKNGNKMGKEITDLMYAQRVSG